VTQIFHSRQSQEEEEEEDKFTVALLNCFVVCTCVQITTRKTEPELHNISFFLFFLVSISPRQRRLNLKVETLFCSVLSFNTKIMVIIFSGSF